MSEERIVAKASDQEKNKSWSVDDEHIRRTSNYIRHSRRGKWLYKYMMFLMFIEGILWGLMDTVRSRRMKVAAKINNNYNDRV